MLRRTFATLTEKVLCKDFPHARLVTLNKPKSLNALDLDMARAVHRYLIDEPLPQASALYIIKGTGPKAFCAGGEVIGITSNTPPGVGRVFFYTESQIIHYLGLKKTNNIALWDGFVMGAGSGVSIPGKFRVATEKALVALPETGIGMVHEGGSWYLPRLPTPGLGLYMALTQHRVKGADLLHTGIATHFVPSEKLPQLEKELCNIGDPTTAAQVIDSFRPSQIPPSTYSAEDLQFLQETFALTPETTMLGIWAKVQAAQGKSKLADKAIKAIPQQCPTALVLTVEMLKNGAQASSAAESIKLDYCIAQRICSEHDFKEGVRALLVDKDKKPKWEKTRLEDVTPEYVAKYFKPTTPDQPVWDPVKPIE